MADLFSQCGCKLLNSVLSLCNNDVVKLDTKMEFIPVLCIRYARYVTLTLYGAPQ